MLTISELTNISSQIRRDIIRMVFFANSGHPGGSLGMTDVFTALFFRFMNFNVNNYNISGLDEDVLIVSNGHISPVLYSSLARAGYFEINELKTFRKINSRLQGHPAVKENLPGVRVATGSLGQGLSFSLGVALQKKIDNDANIVYVLLGDGELQEGQNWEAIMFASHNNIDNLIAIVDCNGRQIDGDTKDIMGFISLKDKFLSFGWYVLEIDNGNSLEQILEILTIAKQNLYMGKPIVVLTKTEMGAGVDFMMGTHEWHGIAPNFDQMTAALSQLPETLGDFKYD
jgi:transketolase